jgi:hypothetical protein
MLIFLGDSIPSSVSTLVVIDALTQWIWVPPVGLLGIYLILLFPDGRLSSRRWRPLVWLSGAVMVLVSVALTIIPGPLPDHPGVRNPFGLEGHPMQAQALPGVVVLLPVCILASAVSLVFRYRHSGGVVRQQIKWVAFAASLVGLVYLITLVSGLLFAPGPLWEAKEARHCWGYLAGCGSVELRRDSRSHRLCLEKHYTAKVNQHQNRRERAID